MQIKSEQDIITEITNKFSELPEARDKIISLYRKNKKADFTLSESFLMKIPREAKYPPSDIQKKYFTGENGKIESERWGEFKLQNIFLAYKNEQWSYYYDQGRWSIGTMSPECISDDKRITP